MEFVVKNVKIEELETDAFIVPYFEGETEPACSILPDGKFKAMLQEIIDTGDFQGKLNQNIVVYTMNNSQAKRIVLMGLGKRTELDREKTRSAFAVTAKKLRSINNIQNFAISLDVESNSLSLAEMAEAAVEGVYLGLYQFTPFKTLDRDKIKDINEFCIIEASEKKISEIKEAVEKAVIICRAVCFTRDLVSAPGNKMTPSDLAKEAQTIAKTRKKVSVKILDEKEMQELGMNALLAVARGSSQPPKFIILEYKGGKKPESPLVLVGKGITFDSGGISLKPSDRMDEMKTDMAGAAAVMGTIMAASDLSLPINVVGLMPATENLPGGKAFKPGDILKSMSGKTIEVLSTDAEGRLILVDALAYAECFKPAAIVDIATLTGACIVALGENIAGLMGTDDDLKRRLKEAAEITGEKIWELPLWEEYDELIKSDVADFKNVGGRHGGAISAASFLKNFVGDYPWAHIDIAGPSWLKKDKSYIPKGASGIGVRLFISFLAGLIKERLKGAKS